jgi:hypothetical protein
VINPGVFELDSTKLQGEANLLGRAFNVEVGELQFRCHFDILCRRLHTEGCIRCRVSESVAVTAGVYQDFGNPGRSSTPSYPL